MAKQHLTYSITYEVPAATRLEAWVKAAGSLRKNVRYLSLVHATRSFGGYWNVELWVEETVGSDDPEWPGDLPEPDAIDQYKGWTEAEKAYTR